jgi:hypothetical protein
MTTKSAQNVAQSIVCQIQYFFIMQPKPNPYSLPSLIFLCQSHIFQAFESHFTDPPFMLDSEVESLRTYLDSNLPRSIQVLAKGQKPKPKTKNQKPKTKNQRPKTASLEPAVRKLFYLSLDLNFFKYFKQSW